jgi:hypothetical protein
MTYSGIELIERVGKTPFPPALLHEPMIGLAKALFNMPVACDQLSWDVDKLSQLDCAAMHHHHAAGRITLSEIPDLPGEVFVSLGKGLTAWYAAETASTRERLDGEWSEPKAPRFWRRELRISATTWRRYIDRGDLVVDRSLGNKRVRIRLDTLQKFKSVE